MKVIDIMEITKDIQEDQVNDMSGFGIEEIIDYTKNSRHKFTAVLNDGTPIASFGVNERPDSVSGMAWGVVGAKAGKHFLSIHKAVLEFLDRCEYSHVYMWVRESFARGHRWTKMLGFEYEKTLENYTRDGENVTLYRRTA